MKKRVISLLLALVMCLSLCTNVFAMEKPVNEIDLSSDDIPCDKYTITFDLPQAKLPADFSKDDLISYEKNIVLPHNQCSAQKAIEYVESLHLPDYNLAFIEESCLAELETISIASDYVLTSYTVLVPVGALSTPAVASSNSHGTMPLADLTYYGTYANRDFYYYTFSESTTSTEYKRTSNRMVAYFNQLIDLVLCFLDVDITVPVTLIRNGLPSGYTPNSSAYCEYYFNVNTRTRGIYTKYYVISSGTYRYDMVTSQQYGHLYPFIVYHPVDSPRYNGSYDIELGWQGVAHTPNYSNKTWQLQHAYNVFQGSTSNVHQRVMDYPWSYYWD